jgi:agmatinase
MSQGHESGRLNLPFVGTATFGRSPYRPYRSRIDADCAIRGVPLDFDNNWRDAMSFGPRGIREVSTIFSFGHVRAHDHEDNIGDADVVRTDPETCHATIEAGGPVIFAAGAVPDVVGSEDSSNAPCISAFAGRSTFVAAQILSDTSAWIARRAMC